MERSVSNCGEWNPLEKRAICKIISKAFFSAVFFRKLRVAHRSSDYQDIIKRSDDLVAMKQGQQSTLKNVYNVRDTNQRQMAA